MSKYPETVQPQENWYEYGWHFRLYTLRFDSSEKTKPSELVDIMKSQIRFRVTSIISYAETLGQGFAIATALSFHTVRIQIYWWTSDCDLYREAVIGNIREKYWERLPSWEIGYPTEIAIICHENAHFPRKVHG